MRFKIHLQTQRKKAFLPIDYQYAMASAIYNLIAKGDEAYSKFLHDEGFSSGGLKKFKLFTFSPLILPHYTPWKEKGLFELHGSYLSFDISFMADKAAEAFVKGMFTDQSLSIGDRFHQLDMEVTSVEAMPLPHFTAVMHYRCLSPLSIELKEPGHKYETYLPPDDPRFEEPFLQNLIAKCAAMNILHVDTQDANETLKFELQSNYKSKLIAIKPYTQQETKVRGFMFDFSLTAPEYMQEMGYYAGFGMNNAMGFGCVISKD
jgi:CRISPR-associated endoribonuclease Cas6